MLTRQKPEISLKNKYTKMLRIGLIGALLLTIGLFVSIPKVETQATQIKEPDIAIENVEIPETQQYEKPPAPQRPTIPIASENEDIAQDMTISETTFEEFEAAAAPPAAPESGPRMKFVAFDEPPILLSGLQIEYPEIAKEAGVQGTIRLRLFINKEGRVEDVVIDKGLPKTGLNEAAIEAVKNTKWKPAQQRDQAVGVWYAFPVRFSLTSAN